MFDSPPLFKKKKNENMGKTGQNYFIYELKFKNEKVKSKEKQMKQREDQNITENIYKITSPLKKKKRKKEIAPGEETAHFPGANAPSRPHTLFYFLLRLIKYHISYAII